MKKRLAIYGAGGLGKEVLSLVRALPEWEVIGYYDDGLATGTLVREGLKVLGGLSELTAAVQPLQIVLAIGSPQTKEHLSNSLKAHRHIQFPTLVHPSVILQDPKCISFGPGCIVGAGSILTTDIQVAEHVLINLSCTIGHDVRIGKFSSVMPGVNLAGEVTIGQGVLIGAGANIINRLEVGDNSRVGAGAVVIRSVPSQVTAVGVPARIIK